MPSITRSVGTCSAPGQPGESGEQRSVSWMMSPTKLARLDDAGPPGLGRHAHAALEEVALAAAEDRLGHAESRRRVVGHRAIVGHADEQRVLGDAEFLELRHHFPDEGIDVALQAVLQRLRDVENFFGLGMKLVRFGQLAT